MLEYRISPVVVAYSLVSVKQKTRNGNFLEQNFANWINEVKCKGSTDLDGQITGQSISSNRRVPIEILPGKSHIT